MNEFKSAHIPLTTPNRRATASAGAFWHGRLPAKKPRLPIRSRPPFRPKYREYTKHEEMVGGSLGSTPQTAGTFGWRGR